jgi:putative transcriptional regulator
MQTAAALALILTAVTWWGPGRDEAVTWWGNATGGTNRARRIQYGEQQQAHAGDLLVSSEKLGDPNFAESVVLIVRHDEEEGTLGLIINRRTEVPLSRIFPDIKGASGDPVYIGGPVSMTAVQALVREQSEGDELRHVLGDVYITGSRQWIEKSIRSHAAPSKFRLYAGYAGWAPGQLAMEVQMGAWTVMANRPKLVFDDDPDSLWARLTHESHMQVAKVERP